MRIDKTFHYCDRCGKEFKDDDDRKRVGRLMEVYKKTTTELKVIVYENSDMNEYRVGYELCKSCRDDFDRWLKNGMR